jgi:hypothetical protein
MSDINPLQPSEGKKTVTSETKDTRHDQEQVKLMGKREAHRRKHEVYVKAMYGSSEEREELR